MISTVIGVGSQRHPVLRQARLRIWDGIFPMATSEERVKSVLSLCCECKAWRYDNSWLSLFGVIYITKQI